MRQFVPPSGKRGGGLGCDTLASVSLFQWASPQEGGVSDILSDSGGAAAHLPRAILGRRRAGRSDTHYHLWQLGDENLQRSKGDLRGIPTVPVWDSLIDQCIFILSSYRTSSPSCWKTIHVYLRKIQVSKKFSLLKRSH